MDRCNFISFAACECGAHHRTKYNIPKFQKTDKTPPRIPQLKKRSRGVPNWLRINRETAVAPIGSSRKTSCFWSFQSMKIIKMPEERGASDLCSRKNQISPPPPPSYSAERDDPDSRPQGRRLLRLHDATPCTRLRLYANTKFPKAEISVGRKLRPAWQLQTVMWNLRSGQKKASHTKVFEEPEKPEAESWRHWRKEPSTLAKRRRALKSIRPRWTLNCWAAYDAEATWRKQKERRKKSNKKLRLQPWDPSVGALANKLRLAA